MMSPTSFWTGAVTLDQLHWLMEPEDTNANVLSGAELRTNNWRAPRFCFCETYTQKEQSGCANSWSFILIWPLDLRPLETWTTAEPWFLIADDTQWTALVRDPTNQPTETIKTGPMSTVSIQHDCAEFIRRLIRRIDGVGAWNDRTEREEGRTCSFNSKKSHESSFGSSCNWDFKLRPDYGDCQGGRAETNLHVVSLMVKIVIIKKWEYVGSFFFFWRRLHSAFFCLRVTFALPETLGAAECRRYHFMRVRKTWNPKTSLEVSLIISIQQRERERARKWQSRGENTRNTRESWMTASPQNKE